MTSSSLQFDAGDSFGNGGSGEEGAREVTAVNSSGIATALIDRTTQEFVFNPPRTYGVRMRVSF